MDNWTFGMTMMLVGLGGTFLTMGLLILLMKVLKKVFPLGDNAGRHNKAGR